MSTASDEPPAPPRLPRAVSQATAPPRAWPTSHVARCALKRGDRRVYFASVEGEVWRYDVLTDACDACWTSGRAVLALAHRGDVCLSLERHNSEIYLAAYDCARSRVVGRQRRVGTGNEGSLSCTEGYVLVSVGRDVALYKNSDPCWRVRNLGDVLAVALSSRGAAVACREGAWLIDRSQPKNARVLDSSTGDASIVATDSVIVLARGKTLTLFSGDGAKRLSVVELGAPLSTASVKLAFGRDGALLTLTSRSLEVRRDGSLVTGETAPPSTPAEQQHVLLRRLIKRVTIGVTDEFGSALLPTEDAGHHWPDATRIDDFDEVGDDFSDEDHVDDVTAPESILDDVRRQRVKCRRAQTATQQEPRLRYRSVLQDDFRPGRGNALQACVASLFGLELQDVPNFITLPEGYEASIRAFCDVRRVAFEKMSLHDIPEAYDGRMCVLRGKSPRGDFGHVVVARFVGACDTSLHKMLLTDAGAFRLVHDPHPSCEFLDEGEACAWAMFFSERN